jgi:hypothetical protein
MDIKKEPSFWGPQLLPPHILSFHISVQKSMDIKKEPSFWEGSLVFLVICST